MTQFKKASLDFAGADATCKGDGYAFVLNDLETSLRKAKGKDLSVDDYLKQDPASFCMQELKDDPKKKKTAQAFVKYIAEADLNKKSISAFDLAYAIYEIYGGQWQENWQDLFANGISTAHSRPRFSFVDRTRAIGAPLLDASADPALQTKALTLLRALSVYAGALPATDPMAAVSASLDYYYNQKEPASFANYLQVSYKDFMAADSAKQADLFGKAVKRQFPDQATAAELFKFLSFPEAVEFTKTAFRENIESSLPLFETVSLPTFRSADDVVERKSEEAMFFPNLPQNTPYKDRQKAIDQFLGKPVLTRKTNIWAGAIKGARTTIKKYIWVGQTEVFSIDSGNKGPTTLIFAPHFHEKNPRKMFHWLKDIPLQTGRIIVIPEANRAMGAANKDTNPMNGLFDEALTDDRPDYLVVRRVEYLMGLVDGMIGVHDAYQGPYYISDLVKTAKSGTNMNPDPIPSPWVPKAVKGIVDINETMAGGAKVTPQAQWQIADFARTKLSGLTGNDYKFNWDSITDTASDSADSASGYMNFHLQKPAMTFEGRKGKEHGQLHAMSIYTLLLGFGHKIDSKFETTLKVTHPVADQTLYIGLPIDPPAAPAKPAPAQPNPGPAPTTGTSSKSKDASDAEADAGTAEFSSD